MSLRAPTVSNRLRTLNVATKNNMTPKDKREDQNTGEKTQQMHPWHPTASQNFPKAKVAFAIEVTYSVPRKQMWGFCSVSRIAYVAGGMISVSFRPGDSQGRQAGYKKLSWLQLQRIHLAPWR